jgi:hypothetical protein
MNNVDCLSPLTVAETYVFVLNLYFILIIKKSNPKIYKR